MYISILNDNNKQTTIKANSMLNKAQIIGNLGNDPRVDTGKNGSTIASFSVATTERGYTTQSGVKLPDKTEWHNVVCFGKLADVVAKYLKKGSKVYIEGKMRSRTYTDKSGIERKVTEINVENMEMLDPKPNVSQQSQQNNVQSQYQQSPQFGDDDRLPF